MHGKLRLEGLSQRASRAFGRGTLVNLGLAALVLAVAPGTLAAHEAPATAPVPKECQKPNLSAAEQARCDFIARTPDLCLRSGLSEDTQRFCDELGVIPGDGEAEEIPWASPTLLPDYIGAPARANPTAKSGVPQNPHLAPNGMSIAHSDAWMSGTVDFGAPLGRNPVTISTTLPGTHRNSWLTPCGNYGFDSHGRLILSCFGKDEASVIMVDPDTLQVLTHYKLDALAGDPIGEGGQDFPPSVWSIYSFLDNRDRWNIVSGGTKIITLRVAGSPSSPEFVKDESYDLSELLNPETDGDIRQVIVDFEGRYWFYVARSATVYLLNPATFRGIGDLKSINLHPGEFIRNGMAFAEDGGVYIVSTNAMYRVDAGADDQPRQTWRQEYITDNQVRPGQTERGSGTTPTILGEGKYVAITDDDVQMHVVVYRTDARLEAGKERVVCRVPVFDFPEGGRGANWNSLVGLHDSIIVQNTADYHWDWADYHNAHLQTPSKPGIERIDIDPDGKGCTKVWVNKQVAGVMTLKLSTRTGLIYTQNRMWDAANNVNAYYFVALDFRTGEVTWQKLMGTGDKFDSIGMPMIMGLNEAIYGPLQGGVVMLKDGARHLRSFLERAISAVDLDRVPRPEAAKWAFDMIDRALQQTERMTDQAACRRYDWLVDRLLEWTRPLGSPQIDDLTVELEDQIREVRLTLDCPPR
jgi:outer membrane protein assembly factor BamB